MDNTIVKKSFHFKDNFFEVEGEKEVIIGMLSSCANYIRFYRIEKGIDTDRWFNWDNARTLKI